MAGQTVLALLRIPVQRQEMKRRREEDGDFEDAPLTRGQRVSSREGTEEHLIRRPVPNQLMRVL